MGEKFLLAKKYRVLELGHYALFKFSLNMSSFWRKMNFFYLKYASYMPEKKAKATKKSKCIVSEKNYIYALSLKSKWNLLLIFSYRLHILKKHCKTRAGEKIKTKEAKYFRVYKDDLINLGNYLLGIIKITNLGDTNLLASLFHFFISVYYWLGPSPC